MLAELQYIAADAPDAACEVDAGMLDFRQTVSSGFEMPASLC